MTTREEAEALRNRDEHWKLGILYACREDPRVIVRNRLLIGWTWNFRHRWALPTILAFIMIGIGPAAVLWTAGVTDGLVLFGVTAVSMLFLVGVAHHIASGPR
ncbi:MAG: hypothetical protein JSW43_00910 [Gemmatimonadota bacterium]|nr:MAG: hypothetical protein JSW43_00910 [Gemmatimonadota bacterium]